MSNFHIRLHHSLEDRVDTENLLKSQVILVLISKCWEQEPLRLQELQLAKEHHIKLVVGVFDGVDTKKYLEGADVLAVKQIDREHPEEGLRELTEIVKSEFYRLEAEEHQHGH